MQGCFSDPWKLYGLPGIILEAADAKQEYNFTCAKIENNLSKNITIEKIPKDYIKTTKQDFMLYIAL